ncbi:Uncharacterised protein [Enterococcus cecorum]|nr:Uncharacterised protein [Enterococcus cecorum]
MDFLFFKLLLLIPSLFIYWISFVIYKLSKTRRKKMATYTILSILIIISTIWAIFIIMFGYNS